MGPAPKRKHVVIVGAGAAGMSCAATLAEHPDKFKVTVLERGEVCGGQATSIPLDENKYGASWMNNGVQGGSPIFKHTFNFFQRYGYEPQEVKLQVAFGKGPRGFWTNVFPSPLVEKYSSDIRKFGFFLKLVKWTMPVLGLVPIRIMLRLLFFSRGFGDQMVYPLIALFLGTGNQTANVPSAIVERLFDDPNMKLWDYDSSTLLPNLPTMVTFDRLHGFYDAWRRDLVSKGVDIRLNTEVTEVESRDSKGVLLRLTTLNPPAHPPGGDSVDGSSPQPQPQFQPPPGFGPRDSSTSSIYSTAAPPPANPDPAAAAAATAATEPTAELFDDLVLCVLADDALRILGGAATRREKFVLSGARFYDDITVTHSDTAYFKRHYETGFDPALCAEPRNPAQREQVALAQGRNPSFPGGFRPIYYTKSYAQDARKIEMSFDCSNYQHQLVAANGPGGQAGFDHVYQTIFLDSRNRGDLWTIDEIDDAKVIQRKWWHQLGHRWQHYVRVVPGMMFLNGRNNTWFAGSWTLVNMHELACVSGIAAAYRLGADYRRFDDFAQDFFSKYLLLSHGVSHSREEARRAKARGRAQHV